MVFDWNSARIFFQRSNSTDINFSFIPWCQFRRSSSKEIFWKQFPAISAVHPCSNDVIALHFSGVGFISEMNSEYLYSISMSCKYETYTISPKFSLIKVKLDPTPLAFLLALKGSAPMTAQIVPKMTRKSKDFISILLIKIDWLAIIWILKCDWQWHVAIKKCRW